MSTDAEGSAARSPLIRLFLCGDVMTGRGIDQILPYPCHPLLHESYVPLATGYVQLAEAASGPIPRRVSPSYIWGAALEEFRRAQPDEPSVSVFNHWRMRVAPY